jgi:hypothetical protein
MDRNLIQARGVRASSKDQLRYHRFMAGESEFELAERDGISLGEARRSIQEGEKSEFERLLSQFLGLQLEAAIDKEEIRKFIRNRFADKFSKALGTLLSGERNLNCERKGRQAESTSQ